MSTFAAIGFLFTAGVIVGSVATWWILRRRYSAQENMNLKAVWDMLDHAARKIADAVDACDTARRKAKGATIERDRLAAIVRRYDRCRCGWFRHHHDGPGPIACRGFDLVEPADPLETIVVGEPFAESLGELASSGN